VEIHARSIFLQGLLLQKNTCRSQYFNRWSKQFEQFENLLIETGCSALEASIRFALGNSFFTKVVIGVQNAQQLKDISVISKSFKKEIKAKHLACDDLDLIRPQNWQLNIIN